MGRHFFTTEDIEKSHRVRIYHPLSEEVRQKISAALQGKKHSKERCRKQGEARRRYYEEHPEMKFEHTKHFKGRCRSLESKRKGGESRRRYLLEHPEDREAFATLAVGKPKIAEHKRKLGLAHIGLKASGEAKRKMSIARRGISFSPEHKQKLSIANRGKHFIPTEIRRIRSKKQWQNPEFVSRFVKALNKKPNKAEIKLQEILSGLFPGEFKYNGDFSLGISIDGCIPDFVNINGKKQVIELFGEYWHKQLGQGEKERIRRFKAVGWDCLVIWSAELKNTDTLATKIKAFVGG